MENYKGNVSASGIVLGSLIAQGGPQGKTGKEGYTPVKGVDYYTEAEKQEIIQGITADVEGKIEPLEQERQSKEQERIENENTRLSKEIERQTAELSRISNEDIRQQKEAIRETQESEREDSENRRMETFLQMQKNVESAINNIEDMTDAYNRNASEKTNDFNNNVTSKTEIFDTNAASKTDVFNQNSTNKTTEFNDNAQERINEFNTNAAALENRVSNLETDNANNKQDILNIKTEQNTQNTKLISLENKNVEQDAEITNIKAEQETQNNKLNNIAEINTTQENSIQELQKSIADLQSYNETNDANMLNIQLEQEKQNNNITMLKGSDYSQDKIIEELQAQVIELETENENIKNQFPVGEAEGENITLTDSAEMEFKELRIGGNSWQETRSGKNKFDSKIIPNFSGGSSGVNLTIDDEGVVTIFNNTNSSGYVSTTKKLKELCPLLKVGDVAYLYLETTHTTKQIWLNGSSEAWVNGNSKTITQSMLDGMVSLYGGNIQTDTLKIQVTLNEPSSAYEPYGAMPSPEFPSEIKNVTGNVNITVCNGNLFNISNVEKGVYYDNGGKHSLANAFAGTVYVKSRNVVSFSIKNKYSSSIRKYVFLYDKDMNYLTSLEWGVSLEAGKKSVMANKAIPSNAVYMTISILDVNPTEIEPSEVVDIMVEFKEKISDYIPHQSQQYTFPLAEGQRMYKDSYLADDGIHNNEKQIELVGVDSENWYTLESQCNDETSWFQCVKPTNVLISNLYRGELLCSYFKNYNCYSNTNKDDGVCIHANGGFQIRINNSYLKDISTLNAKLTSFKEYLAEQKANGTPLIIQYPLAEEIIEPYTEEQQLVYNEIKKAHSYKNVTHIFSTDEIKPQIEVVYRKDWETINQKQEDRILALENAVLGGN